MTNPSKCWRKRQPSDLAYDVKTRAGGVLDTNCPTPSFLNTNNGTMRRISTSATNVNRRLSSTIDSPSSHTATTAILIEREVTHNDASHIASAMPASLSAAFFAMAESSQSPRSASQCVQRCAPTVVFAIIWDVLARFIRMISAGHLGDEASSLELGSR